MHRESLYFKNKDDPSEFGSETAPEWIKTFVRLMRDDKGYEKYKKREKEIDDAEDQSFDRALD